MVLLHIETPLCYTSRVIYPSGIQKTMENYGFLNRTVTVISFSDKSSIINSIFSSESDYPCFQYIHDSGKIPGVFLSMKLNLAYDCLKHGLQTFMYSGKKATTTW